MLGITYLTYILLSLALTMWVGRTLSRNGRVFLSHNYDELALVDAITSMLLVGFYLINIGFVAYTLKITGDEPRTWTQGLEFLSVKIGFIAIVLGIMHFALMIALQKYSGFISRAVPAVAVHPTPAMAQATAPANPYMPSR